MWRSAGSARWSWKTREEVKKFTVHSSQLKEQKKEGSSMKKYRLKPGVPEFDVVDGEYKGRKFRRGKVYTEIPPEEKHRFEPVEKPKPKLVEPPKKAGATAQNTAQAEPAKGKTEDNKS
jgi:hypothetical protein